MIRRIFPLIVGAVLLVGFPATEAQANDGKLVLRVLVDASGSFDKATADSAIGIAFFVRGTICEDPEPGASCDSIGTFLCWGWQSDPSDVDARPQVSVVSQEFNIFDRGKIQTQGVEAFGPDSARAVVGGTGDFRNVRGEVPESTLPYRPSLEPVSSSRLSSSREPKGRSSVRDKFERGSLNQSSRYSLATKLRRPQACRLWPGSPGLTACKSSMGAE